MGDLPRTDHARAVHKMDPIPPDLERKVRALAPVLVSAALMVGGMIAAEAGLSFLGIGIRPPTPSWGNIISLGQDALLVALWIAFFPGCLLALTILCFNLLADALRDALDPKTLPKYL
jgi:peptide/nickel transport system permease protein